jgi:glutaredoxin
MVEAQVTEYTYGEHFTKEQFYSEFGEGATFPQVVIDQENVGGCTETVKVLRERGLV